MRLGGGGSIAVGLVAAWPTAAYAAGSGGEAGPSEVVFLAQIVVLVAAGRLLGEAMQRLGQPSVMGQLLAGIFLGP
ncbi:MAG: potassium transporter, partial [Methylobacteriaceae bacterium]|nr:potassium transporter [Methylobacteriaceae bacterium]